MKTVVTVTPLRVEADTRTLKQAASVARFGYRSIVVEGEPSAPGFGYLPFELRAMKPARPVDAAGQPGDGASRKSRLHESRLLRGSRGFQRHLRKSPAGPPLAFARFLVDYTFQYVLRPLRRVPAASAYYLHSPYQFPAVAILARRHRARVIYDAHDFYSGIVDDHEVRRIEDRWSTAFLRWIERACVANADAVVTVSDGIAGLQRAEFGCDPIVLRNCHDSRLESPRIPGLREALGLSPDAFLLVTIGQAKPGQAISEALEAMAGLPQHVHLAFVGRNYEQYQAAIEARGLTARVHVVPAVGANEVAPFIRSADAALILYYSRSVNYAHCLPNGFFQAIAAELPVLYPDLPEISKVASAFEIGIAIDPRDAATISSAVLSVIDQREEERARLVENLRQAREELSWEREELKLRDLLHDVLQEQQ